MTKKKQKFNKKWLLLGIAPIILLALTSVPIATYRTKGCPTKNYVRVSWLLGGNFDEGKAKDRIIEESIQKYPELNMGCDASINYRMYIL